MIAPAAPLFAPVWLTNHDIVIACTTAATAVIA